MPTKREVLEEAIKSVDERGKPYGGVEDNFQRIANLWNAHIINRYQQVVPLDPKDVAMMMVLVKIARLATAPSHPDSWVDIAGYAACGGSLGGEPQP
jgi:hypothetical protein